MHRNSTFYHPQRSCGKVMFSQASVILFTGGLVYASINGGRHPPPADRPWTDTPWADTTHGRTPPRPLQRRYASKCVPTKVFLVGRIWPVISLQGNNCCRFIVVLLGICSECVILCIYCMR